MVRLLGLWSYIGEVRSTAEGDSGWIHSPELFRLFTLATCARTNPYGTLLYASAPFESNRRSRRRLVCLCSHTTHNAAAEPTPACFRLSPVLAAPATAQCVPDSPTEFRRQPTRFRSPAPVGNIASVIFLRQPWAAIANGGKFLILNFSTVVLNCHKHFAFSEDLKLSRFSPLPTARLACASIPM